MKLTIRKYEENIIVSFGNEELKISEKFDDQSNQWNTLEINKFLIKLASKTPSGEKIIFENEITNDEKDKVFLHISDLFNEFVNEFNKRNEQLNGK